MSTSWTTQDRETDTTGEGFLSAAGSGFLSEPFLSSGSGSYSLQTKVTDTWTKQTKEEGA